MSSSKNPKSCLVASFMQFLTDELGNPSLSDDSKESIEVGIQCLETAFGINPLNAAMPSKKPLLEIFSAYLENNKEAEAGPTKPNLSAAQKEEADKLKNEANVMMKDGKFSEALATYTKAIEIDSTNPIYYCNRAAAYSKLGRDADTLEDCKMAIKYDPSYSKAYCRMGLAYVNLNDHLRARDAYKMAAELDPTPNNQRNLELAEQKLEEQNAHFNSGFNFGNILSNPNLMSFATQMMADPNMQNMLSGFVNNAMGPNQEGPPGGLDAFLQAGQQFAQQMQNSNPELVEQLKSAFKKPEDQKDPDQNQEPKN